MSAWHWNLAVGSVGLLLAALVALALLRIWRRQPVRSYGLLVAVLIAALVVPVVQVVAQRSGLSRALPFAPQLAGLRAALERSDANGLDASYADRIEPYFGDVDVADAGDSVGYSITLAAHVIDAPDDAPISDAELLEDLTLLGATVDADGVVRFPEDASFVLVDGSASSERETGWLVSSLSSIDPATRDGVLKGLALVYLLGLLVSFARTALRLARTDRLVRGAEPVADPRVLNVWHRLLETSPLRERVRLLTSPEVQGPMCFGLRKPVVLLPAAEDPSIAPDILKCVLLHELVHLERRDTWVMLTQEVLRGLFWFHPAAWWLSRRIDALRELSCDILVVRRTGRRKRYASALVEYAAWMRRGLAPHQPAPSAALLRWTSSNSQLARRIEMLVNMSSVTKSSRRTTIVAAGAAFSMLWGGQVALAAAISPAQDGDVEKKLESCEGTVCDAEENAELAELLGLLDGIDLSLPADVEEAQLVDLALPAKQQADGPRLGISLTVDEDAKTMTIVGVEEGAPAARVGFQMGDVITKINGSPATWDAMTKAKQALGANDSMKVELKRGDKTVTIVFDTNEELAKAPHAHGSAEGKKRVFSISGDLKSSDGRVFVMSPDGKHEVIVGDSQPIQGEWVVVGEGDEQDRWVVRAHGDGHGEGRDGAKREGFFFRVGEDGARESGSAPDGFTGSGRSEGHASHGFFSGGDAHVGHGEGKGGARRTIVFGDGDGEHETFELHGSRAWAIVEDGELHELDVQSQDGGHHVFTWRSDDDEGGKPRAFFLDRNGEHDVVVPHGFWTEGEGGHVLFHGRAHGDEHSDAHGNSVLRDEDVDVLFRPRGDGKAHGVFRSDDDEVVDLFEEFDGDQDHHVLRVHPFDAGTGAGSGRKIELNLRVEVDDDGNIRINGKDLGKGNLQKLEEHLQGLNLEHLGKGLDLKGLLNRERGEGPARVHVRGVQGGEGGGVWRQRIEELPAEVRERVQRAMKDMDGGPHVFELTQEQREKIRDAAENARRSVQFAPRVRVHTPDGSKPFFRSRSEGAPHEEHAHEAHGDDQRVDLESKIEKLRRLMREREAELEKLRNELKQLHERGASGESKQREQRIDWSADDQASAAPTAGTPVPSLAVYAPRPVSLAK